jgi:CRP/FNR family transcriptional regulator, cyclic AMP receptor protein
MIDQAFLQKITLFRDLEEEQTKLLLSLIKEVTFPPNHRILEEGKVGEGLFMITLGKVRVTRAFDQETFVLTELGPGDFFGEMSLIDDYAASANVESITETSILVLSRSNFKSLTSSSNELSSKLWESLARNLSAKIRKTGNLVKMYYGLNKALCENPEFRQLYTSWNYHLPGEDRS